MAQPLPTMRVSTPLKTRFTIRMHVMATPLMGTDLATRSALVITDVMVTPMEDSADTAVLDSVMARTQDTAVLDSVMARTQDTEVLDSVMARTLDTEVGGTASALRLLSSTDAPVELMESVGDSPALVQRGDGW